MQFNDAEIAKKYELTEVGQGNPTLVIGRLSVQLADVTDPAYLDGMIKRKTNLVKLKETAKKPSVNYTQLGFEKLKELAAEQKITVPDNAKKDDIIALLKKAEEAQP